MEKAYLMIFLKLEPPKYLKIKLEVKKTMSMGASCWKYYFSEMFIKPSMIEWETWD